MINKFFITQSVANIELKLFEIKKERNQFKQMRIHQLFGKMIS